MMTFDRLPDTEREYLSTALAEHLGDYWRRRRREKPREELPAEPRFTLHESMRVSILDLPDAFETGTEADAYERGGERWHHQIHVDGEPRMYARTAAHVDPESPDADGHQLVEIGSSAVVPEITSALEELDEVAGESADGVVRLLVAPSRAFYALAVVRDGRIDEVIRLAVSEEEKRDLSEGRMARRTGGKKLLGMLAELPSAYGIGGADERPRGKGGAVE